MATRVVPRECNALVSYLRRGFLFVEEGMDMITEIAKSLAIALHQQVTVEDIKTLLEKPKNRAMGDFALPCFKLSKQLSKSPQTIATEIQKM